MFFCIIGFIAFFTSTISLVPQLYRTYTTKSANDLSWLMLLNFAIGSVSWIIYGVMIDAVSVWLTNVIMTVCSLILLGFKAKYSAR